MNNLELKFSEGKYNLYLLGDIGLDGIKAEELIKTLEPIKGEPLRIYINSPGGSVFEGLTIYNYLKNAFPNLETENLGLCASIASIIFLAGKTRVMNNQSFLMIHEAWSGALGNADELRKTADILEKITSEIISIYSENCALTNQELIEALKNETWLNAEESLTIGFATEISLGSFLAVASLKTDSFKNIPESFLNLINIKNEIEETPVNETPEEILVNETPIEETQLNEEKEVVKLDIENQKIISSEITEEKQENIIMENFDVEMKDKEVESFKAFMMSKGSIKPVYQNATLTASDGYGVPAGIGAEIIRLRDKKSFIRQIARNVKTASPASFSFAPNTGAAEYVTGAYPDLTTAGTLINAVPAKLGGKYTATEDVNDFSVLNVLEEFKIDASKALIKGENIEFVKMIVAESDTTNVSSGAWTFAKVSAVKAGVSEDFAGNGGAWFVNASHLGDLMSIQTNGAGSPLLFQPVEIAEDGRVGTMLGCPVYLSSQVASGATGKLLWFVAQDSCVVVDFQNGVIKTQAGQSESTGNLYLNTHESIYMKVADKTGIVSLTFA